jgi:AcrR family transcriptional regulator
VPPEPVAPSETRGRPRLRRDDEILDAALLAFATHGYAGMSLRKLNSELGLSHGTISHRYGSKERLYYAAVDHGFGGLIAEMDDEIGRRPPATDELAQVRERFRAFLVVSARRPELVRLMNQEGLHASDRLNYIFDTYTQPALADTLAALERLASAGVLRPLPARALFFLLTHGAAAPYTLTALSARFDPVDGPLDELAHAELITDVTINALRRPGP